MNTAGEVLAIARAEIGVKESPPDSNNVKYNTWYYGKPVCGDAFPWCMAFVQWVMSAAKVAVPIQTVSCGTLMTRAKRAGQWVTGDYRPGDVLIYNFGKTTHDHTGICESFDGKYVIAIEGNTSASNASNGGEVMRMTRRVTKVTGAWRPDYIIETEDEDMAMQYFGTINDVPEWYRPSIQKLIDAGALRGTDDTGEVLNVSEDFCRIMTVLDRLGILF